MAKIIEFVLILIVGYLYFSLFFLVAYWASVRGFTINELISLPWDFMVTFDKNWIVFYALSNIVPVITVSAIFIRRERNIVIIRQFFFATITLLTISYIIFLVFPSNSLPLFDPAIARLPDEGIINRLVLWQLHLDTVWNAFPSFHVSLGWMCYRFYADYFPKTKYFFFIWFILMCISTIMLRFHYILDVVGGWFLGEVVFYMFMRKIKLSNRSFTHLLFSGKRYIKTYLVVIVMLSGVMSLNAMNAYQMLLK
ncbi:TPA: phosphatase PAP2 family protein [Legionella anisa]